MVFCILRQQHNQEHSVQHEYPADREQLCLLAEKLRSHKGWKGSSCLHWPTDTKLIGFHLPAVKSNHHWRDEYIRWWCSHQCKSSVFTFLITACQSGDCGDELSFLYILNAFQMIYHTLVLGRLPSCQRNKSCCSTAARCKVLCKRDGAI